MNKRQARNKIADIFDIHTKGVHRDSYWTPIHKVLREMEGLGLGVSITHSAYEHENGVPVRKVWTGVVDTEQGPLTLRIVAAGCGSVKEPLEAYDVVGYAS